VDYVPAWRREEMESPYPSRPAPPETASSGEVTPRSPAQPEYTQYRLAEMPETIGSPVPMPAADYGGLTPPGGEVSTENIRDNACK